MSKGLIDAKKFYSQTSLHYRDWGQGALAVNAQIGSAAYTPSNTDHDLGWTFSLKNPEAKKNFTRLYDIVLRQDGTLDIRSFEKNLPSWGYSQIAHVMNTVYQALIDNGFGAR